MRAERKGRNAETTTFEQKDGRQRGASHNVRRVTLSRRGRCTRRCSSPLASLHDCTGTSSRFELCFRLCGVCIQDVGTALSLRTVFLLIQLSLWPGLRRHSTCSLWPPTRLLLPSPRAITLRSSESQFFCLQVEDRHPGYDITSPGGEDCHCTRVSRQQVREGGG